MPTCPDLTAARDDSGEDGFTGAMGSTDVRWEGTPCPAKQSYVGEEKVPTLAYKCPVGHFDRCLGATKGHPGAEND